MIYMTIHYKTSPKTFAELVDSCRGQMERQRELSIDGKKVPFEECVIITTESFLDTMEQIEHIHHSLNEQLQINKSIQQIFFYMFDYLGIQMEDDEEYHGYEEEWWYSPF